MMKKVIICEIGLPIDTSDDEVIEIMDKLYNVKHPKIMYIDQSVEEVEEED